jgi:hypothetical protein
MAEADPFRTGHDPACAGDASERAKRDSLFLLTTIAQEGGAPRGQAKVRNLSATGLMADCDHMFSQGERVEIALRGIGQVRGSVAWARGSRIGVAFDRPIDPQQARKPVQDRPAEDLPPYLRHLNRASRFTR